MVWTAEGTPSVTSYTLRRCESNCVDSTHDAYENTWKCGELKLLFFPVRRRLKNKKTFWFTFSLTFQYPEPVRNCQADKAQQIYSATLHVTVTNQEKFTQLHDLNQQQKLWRDRTNLFLSAKASPSMPHITAAIVDEVTTAAPKWYRTQATVGGSLFGPFISVARGHSREKPLSSYAILRFLYVLHWRNQSAMQRWSELRQTKFLNHLHP